MSEVSDTHEYRGDKDVDLAANRLGILK